MTNLGVPKIKKSVSIQKKSNFFKNNFREQKQFNSLNFNYKNDLIHLQTNNNRQQTKNNRFRFHISQNFAESNSNNDT